MQQITILGATGSIGQSTLAVIDLHPERYRVFALTAHQRIEELARLCLRYQPRYAVVQQAADISKLAALLHYQGTEILAGTDALAYVASHAECDTVMAAIVGAAGLLPTLAAVHAGKRVLLANKEALVMAGALFMRAVQEAKATLLPIDSEHNAIFQCLPAHYGQGLTQVGVERILLTASGGPFRQFTMAQLAAVTPEQACKHPNWVMGRKISVDSATLMNKGLEFIEACWLFNARPEQVQIVIHPQSIIHSLVQYVDGSTLAQLGNPDMRTPIANALAFPERIQAGVSALDLCQHHLQFYPPDEQRFPCLALARQAMQQGGTTPAILNAANEVAVAAFLNEQLPFIAIPQLIETVLTQLPMSPADNLETILAADEQARQLAQRALSRY
ncbi:1-deoxy-D-xylulose 5-phosphate reductoisomerase [Agitococcus lubricus]|uniref:1-deoxy-D-xylulose 5-phosphate reductoisomerase n=2 Tax=Agitococcus lubricus TaxID=1077255 RepID=A0A2T5J1J1_9GAMM|nr:1-deoxy-D-xylulose 5-phosphate reductoisomerase [Agitococcus lubricus]